VELSVEEKKLEDSIALSVLKQENDCTPEDRRLRALEWIRVKKSFVHFVKYCKLVDPPTAMNPGGIVPFKTGKDGWKHIDYIMATFLTRRLIVILKSRQIGASWICAAYDLWFALTHVGALVILFSKGLPEAKEKLAKCKRIYDQLPDFMRLKIDPDSTEELGFPVMKSSIKAFAATENAGISFTASIIDCDEWEEHPYASQNFTAAKPCIDAGGQFIGTFTVNKRKPSTLAKSIFKDSVGGRQSEDMYYVGQEAKNGFTPLFFGWKVRQERDSEWYQKTKDSIPPEELDGLRPELYMEQNYPASISEALRPTQTVSAFDLSVLDDMMSNIRHHPVIKVVRDGIDTKIVNIFKDFHIGEYFIAATDTSHGMGQDYSVTGIMNVRTGEIVADILRNDLSPEELAWHSIRMLEVFKSPLWYIENNDWGGTTISTAVNLNYKSLGYDDEKRTRLGFNTQGSRSANGLTGSRIQMWGQLIPAINNRQITIYNPSGIRQFYDIIRNSEKNGRIEAMSRRNDDYPTMVAICWFKRKSVSVEEFESDPIETLTFNKQGGWRDRWPNAKS